MDRAVELRPATDADAGAVRNLVFTVLREYGLTPDPAATDADLYALESSYSKAGGSFDVLVDTSGVVIGTVGLSPRGEGRCELRKMYAVRHRLGVVANVWSRKQPWLDELRR